MHSVLTIRRDSADGTEHRGQWVGVTSVMLVCECSSTRGLMDE